ncbi:MAG: GNAT family N-acetyltransferase [Anaerolineaceae bacterium]|nr:MAG: GNAT family N-acetyltransferase [Anaerolineaceae bacterium]
MHRLTAADLPRLRQFWEEHWDAEFVVAHGTVFHPENVSGFIALDGNEWVGLITYTFLDTDCEIVSIDSLRENEGIGTALIEKVVEEAKANQCRRVHVSTTNANLRALGFYQKRGFRLSALYPDAVNEARKLKPEIPLIGENGIPLRDEIELEMLL